MAGVLLRPSTMTTQDLSEPTLWAQSVFGSANLGDERRTKRLVLVAAQLAGHLGCSPAAACGASSATLEGANRLIRNPGFNAQDILDAGLSMSAESAKKRSAADENSTLREYLAIQDSTVLSYSHSVRNELGETGGPPKSTARGWIVHSTLLWAIGETSVIELVDQQWSIRKELGKRQERNNRPYEQKESFKWQAAHKRMTQRLGPEFMKQVIMVGDREADIFQLMAYFQEQPARYVVRASWDRAVQGSQENEYLWGTMEKAARLGSRQVQVPQRGGRKARSAQLELRAQRVQLRRPRKKAPGTPEYLEVNAVYAKEENAPLGEEPLEWMILTSEEIGSEEAVNRILAKYETRWQIEEFHKAWKSGTKVEELRQQTADNLQKVAVILGFIAVRLLKLKHYMEKAPQKSCNEVLKAEEWKILWGSVEKTALPENPPDIQWAYKALARLAGWTDTKRTGRASWDTLWKGWQRLSDRIEGWLTGQRILRGEM